MTSSYNCIRYDNMDVLCCLITVWEVYINPFKLIQMVITVSLPLPVVTLNIDIRCARIFALILYCSHTSYPISRFYA